MRTVSVVINRKITTSKTVLARFWLPNESLQGNKPNGELTEPVFCYFLIFAMVIQKKLCLVDLLIR